MSTFLNLTTSVSNADGSTTVYSAAGAALKTSEPDATSLIYAGSSGAAQPTPVWFAPAPSTTLLSSIMNGDGAFQTTMGGVTVFKMYEAMLTLPDSTLQPFFSYLSAHHISLAIEGLGLVAGSGQPGYGAEGFAGSSSDLSSLLTKLKADGGDLGYIAFDQPYTSGVLDTGLSMSTAASEVASAASQVKAIFPNAKIGDIEPVGASSSQTAQLQSWFNAYASASGSPFDFFEEDVSGWYSGWQNTVASVTAMARARGMTVNDIVEGNGVAATDQAWSTQADSMAMQILSDPRLRPDALVVQSWQANPGETMDPTQAGTLASVLRDLETGMPQRVGRSGRRPIRRLRPPEERELVGRLDGDRQRNRSCLRLSLGNRRLQRSLELGSRFRVRSHHGGRHRDLRLHGRDGDPARDGHDPFRQCHGRAVRVLAGCPQRRRNADDGSGLDIGDRLLRFRRDQPDTSDLDRKRPRRSDHPVSGRRRRRRQRRRHVGGRLDLYARLRPQRRRASDRRGQHGDERSDPGTRICRIRRPRPGFGADARTRAGLRHRLPGRQHHGRDGAGLCGRDQPRGSALGFHRRKAGGACDGRRKRKLAVCDVVSAFARPAQRDRPGGWTARHVARFNLDSI